jgi:hypothetical protein
MESHRRYGYMPRCPDLRWDDAQGRYLCGLMLDPETASLFRRTQHEGQGCCAPLNGWRDDVRNRDED